MNIVLIRGTKEFYAMRDEWNELLQRSDQDTIFLRWEWLYNWWLIYGKPQNELHICTVRDGHRLLGVAPLYVRKEKYPFPLRKISFLGSNVVASDYLDFILCKDKENDALRAILSFLRANACWDLLSLSDISSTSKVIPYAKEYFHALQMDVNSNYTVCPYLPLSSPWEAIHNSFLPSLKNTLLQKRKRFEARHAISFVEVGPDEEPMQYFLDFLRLNRLRFEGKGMRSPFCDRNFLDFHKSIIEELHKRGLTKFIFFKADGQYIAAIYLFHYRNKFFYYQSGFDPAWSSYSPGSLLFYFCIKTGHERGVEEFDFLQGAEEYKNSWTSNKRYNAEISIWNSTPGGYLLKSVKRSTDFLRKNIRGRYGSFRHMHSAKLT